MSKNNKIKKVDWSSEFAQYVASETYSLLNTASGMNDKNKDLNSKEVINKFIGEFIKIVVYQNLSEFENSQLTTEEKYEKTKENFFKIKTVLQDQVIYGFEKAVKKYSGLDVDYFCLIKPAPEENKMEM